MWKILLCLASLFVAATSYAMNIIGVRADGEKTVYVLDDVLGITANEETLMSVINKDGSIKSGYAAIKFTDEEKEDDGVSDARANKDIKVYPNPVKNVLYLIGAEEDTEIIVIDMQGKVVLRERGESVNVENLSNGLYVLIAGGKRVKFIKE